MAEQDKISDLEKTLARLERKLDKLSKDVNQDSLAGLPDSHNVSEGLPEGTIPPPVVKTTEFSVKNPRHMNTLQAPPTPTADQTIIRSDQQGEPVAGYDKMTMGEILKAAKEWSPGQRQVVLDYERRNKKRDQIVEAFVNWNS